MRCAVRPALATSPGVPLVCTAPVLPRRLWCPLLNNIEADTREKKSFRQYNVGSFSVRKVSNLRTPRKAATRARGVTTRAGRRHERRRARLQLQACVWN